MAEDYRQTAGVAPLRNINALIELVERVQAREHGLPGMACFYGRSGDGKSMAGVYAANRFDAVLVQVKSVWSPRLILEKIATEAGYTVRRKDRTGDLLERIADILAVSGRPLIIDEADYLVRGKTIEMVRDIHEASGASVILIGEEGMPQKLAQWERVDGRMLDWVAAQPGDLSDIKRLEPIYANGLEVTPELRQAILVASNASIRRICVNLNRIAEFARTRGLAQIGTSEWDAKKLFTGQAPHARRFG